MRTAAAGSGVLGFVRALRRINRILGLVGGMALLATVALILVEIVGRGLLGRGLGGADEISGYVMAGVATWGFAYALVERAHVRIDVVQARLPRPGQVALDLLALSSLSAISAMVAIHGWSVLAKTLERGSRANTPLETPLWIPQSIWFAGWVWFAITSAALLVCALILLFRRPDGIERIAGSGSVEGEPA